MATLDWSQCSEVESVPGKVGGAWVFKDTRMPVSAVFENLESGASIEEIMEWFHLTREQIRTNVSVSAFICVHLRPFSFCLSVSTGANRSPTRSSRFNASPASK